MSKGPLGSKAHLQEGFKPYQQNVSVPVYTHTYSYTFNAKAILSPVSVTPVNPHCLRS